MAKDKPIKIINAEVVSDGMIKKMIDKPLSEKQFLINWNGEYGCLTKHVKEAIDGAEKDLKEFIKSDLPPTLWETINEINKIWGKRFGEFK